MISIGLVLGAGGPVGAAYHTGVVSALHDVTGWDARTADLIVGTSAGAGIAASLRAGLSPTDHLARATDRPLSTEGAALVAGLPPRLPLPTVPFRFRGLPLPASPTTVASALLSGGRAGVALAGLLPRGAHSGEAIGGAARGMHRNDWPERPTWICAVRLGDGSRVVFGRDEAPEPDIGTAVQASSAIPGVFQPVRVGGRDFVDGGIHSSTNADLVAGLGFDLVIVSAPMSAVPRARELAALPRALSARQLGREVDAVRRSGTRVLVFQPIGDDLAVMGLRALDTQRRNRVARQARRSALARLARPEVEPLVLSLGDRAAPAR